jgi:hypothetical protein
MVKKDATFVVTKKILYDNKFDKRSFLWGRPSTNHAILLFNEVENNIEELFGHNSSRISPNIIFLRDHFLHDQNIKLFLKNTGSVRKMNNII